MNGKLGSMCWLTVDDDGDWSMPLNIAHEILLMCVSRTPFPFQFFGFSEDLVGLFEFSSFFYSFFLLWIMNFLHAFDLNTIFIIQWIQWNTQCVFVCTLCTRANASSTKDEKGKK